MQIRVEESVEWTPRAGLDAVRRHIVEAALQLAQQEGSWDAVHVHGVARQAGISLAELSRHFDGKDDIAEGFFDLADAALLAVGEQPGWARLRPRERLYRAIMAWLDALAPYHRVALEMLRYKVHPEHIHLQARGIMRISRTVQWLREVCLMPSVGWRRELEEAALTSIYLTIFRSWLRDDSAGNQGTRRRLQRLLMAAEGGALLLGFGARGRGAA